MELTESINSINQQLVDLFGIDTLNGLPIWRIVWSPDQLEKQKGTFIDYTSEGIFIRSVTEVREIKKYPWIGERYILEQLSLVPDVDSEQLLEQKIVYGVIWVFETQLGEYLPPKIEVCQFVINSIHAAMGKSNLAKYKDTDNVEKRIKEVGKLQEDMFGNETDTGDALAYGEAIIVPRNYGVN